LLVPSHFLPFKFIARPAVRTSTVGRRAQRPGVMPGALGGDPQAALAGESDRVSGVAH
jgi:hypothetical protein